MTTRILLLRHAETAAPGQFHGAESDVDLGENGRNQAREAATDLAGSGASFLYTSPMLRARQTAEPIGRVCGLTPIIIPDLHERKMGPLSGKALAEGWPIYTQTMARWKAGDLDATHEGGESYRQMRERLVPSFLKIGLENEGQTSIIVAHGVVIRVLLTSVLEGYGPAHFDEFGIDFVAVNDLRFDGGVWRAVGLNGSRISVDRG